MQSFLTTNEFKSWHVFCSNLQENVVSNSTSHSPHFASLPTLPYIWQAFFLFVFI